MGIFSHNILYPGLILATLCTNVCAQTLIHKNISSDPLIPILTKQVANEYIGEDLFVYPYAHTQIYNNGSWVTFVTDPAWNRIVYGEVGENQIKSFGSWGSGDGQFYHPQGIHADNDGTVYVTDTFNGRIVKLQYDFGSHNLNFLQNITGSDMRNPWDLTVDVSGYLWVVDRFTSKIYLFDSSGNFLTEYGGYGSDVGQFKHPEAIGRVNRPEYDVAVADNGNAQFVALTFNSATGNVNWVWSFTDPVMSSVTDFVMPPWYGEPWVIDHWAGKIQILGPHLGGYWTSVGELGTGNYQFYYPYSAARASSLLNFSVSELWGDNSGGKRYIIGTDIRHLMAAPLGNNGAWFHWVLTVAADLEVRVLDRQGNLVRQIWDPFFNLAGFAFDYWDGTNEDGQLMPNDFYTIELIATAYCCDPPEVVTQVTKSIEILTGCGVKGDVNRDGVIDILDIVMIVDMMLEGRVGQRKVKMSITYISQYTECQWWAADFNNDGIVDVFDIVAIIDFILGNAKRQVYVQQVPAEAGVRFPPDASSKEATDGTIQITLSTNVPVAAIHFEMGYDSVSMSLQEPTLGSFAGDMSIQFDVYLDTLGVVVYSTDGSVIEPGSGIIVEIPYDGILGRGGAPQPGLGMFDMADPNGNRLWTIVVSDDLTAIQVPRTYTLYPAYPNPFNPITTLRYFLPEASNVDLAIFNILGQKVWELKKPSESAGEHKIFWNGRTLQGDRLSSGVYIYRFSAGSIESGKEFHQTRKMVLLR